jgi:phosphatidylserine decarboxylase
MARDGYPYVLIPLALGLIALALGYRYAAISLFILAALFLLIAAFMAYFFRDPQRTAPVELDVIVSPADGRVTRVCLLAPDSESSPTVVSIFLSPLDVHINRAPIAGKITNVTYTKGKFLMATKEDASLVNEQNALTIEGAQMTLVCKQIAGVLARRIVCWKKVGDRLALGERFGLIKFSSRTDLILPPQVSVLVRVGDRVRGGATVIGRMI